MGLAGLVWIGLAAAQQPEVDWGGRFQSDLRFRVFHQDDPTGPWFAPVEGPPGVVRNQNLLNVRMRAKDRGVRGVLDMDLVMTGYPGSPGTPGRFDQLRDLSDRTQVEPVRVETHAMYLEGRDLGLEGLDLRVGQQLVQFGVGDQFNPTNVFNPNDVEDVLQFGEQMGNLMARADYGLGSWVLTGVLIPVFKPALLPSTAPLALRKVSRLPFEEDPLRWRIHAETRLARLQGYPTVVEELRVVLPPSEPRNMPHGVHLGGVVGNQDVGLLYYRGFADVPVPTAVHTRQEVFAEPLCQGPYGIKCIDGMLRNEITLEYPAIQVLGYNMAGEVNPLFFVPGVAPLGYRIEAAVVFPEQVRARLIQDEIAFGPLVQPAGEYDYGADTPGDGPHGGRPVVLAGTPYPKWVVGLDYTLGMHWMVNAQWVHGMFDELGAGDNLLQREGYAVRQGGVGQVVDAAGERVDQVCGPPRLLDPDAPRSPGFSCAEEVLRRRQSDLAVVGVDLNLANRAALLRLFTLTDLTGIRFERYDEERDRRVGEDRGAFTPEGRSGVVLLEGDWNFGNGFDLGAGLLVQYGAPYTRFGDPAAGGSFVFTRARYAF